MTNHLEIQKTYICIMKKTILIALVFCFGIISCEKDSIIDLERQYPASKHKIAEIVFYERGSKEGFRDIPAGNINGKPFGIGLSFTINGNPIGVFSDSIFINHSGVKYTVARLKYFLSDIYIHKYYEQINGISFTMGLNKEKNISNAYVNEVFHPTMFWPEILGGGYHYMKLEGKTYGEDTIFYNTHTGGTDGYDYSFNKYFAVDANKHVFNMNRIRVDGSTYEYSYIVLNMDIAKWYSNPNTINFEGGIMENPQRQQELQENGELDVFSIVEHE